MDVIVLAIASVIWGAVLFGVAAVLQAATSLAGAARQTLWRIAAVLLIAPWIAAPLADLAGIGLPAPAAVTPAPVIETINFESFSADTLPSAEPAVAVAPSPAAPAQPIPWASILIAAIAAGWAWRLAAARLAARSLRRIVSASTEAGPGPARQSLAAWSRKLGLRTEPRLRIVAEGLSPFSFGILRPVICLPAGLERQLDREALDLVVAHECLHAARGDGWLRPLERFVADLLWFNPFAWRIRRELDVARELACDEAVLKHARAHRAYAHTLRNVAGIAAGLGPAVPAASMSLAGSPRSLMLRMRQALAGARAKPAWTALAGVAVFGVTGTLAACMQGVAAAPRVEAPVAPRAQSEQEQASVASNAEPNSAETSGSEEPTPSQTPAARIPPKLGFDRKTSPIVSQSARLTANYGYMPDPFTGRTMFHEGIDLAASWGASILAPVDGEITYAGAKGSYGRLVELDAENGVKMRFGHLNVISVKLGEEVRAGQKLGTMGATGRTTGPHVHFEYLRDGKSYDPVTVENLVLATSLKIDLQTQPESTTPPASPNPAAPEDTPPAPSPTPIQFQQTPAPAAAPLIRAWYPARVLNVQPGRKKGFRVDVVQTADTDQLSECWAILNQLVDLQVERGQELKIGDPIGRGAWGEIEVGVDCERGSETALNAAFPGRAAAMERRFSTGSLSAVRRGGYDPSAAGREIKAWYPAKVMVADGDAQTGYKVRLVQTRNTDSVSDCTVTLSNMHSLQVTLLQTLNEGDVIGAGAPDNMTFQVMCRESLAATGRSPMLDAFPELRQPQSRNVSVGLQQPGPVALGLRAYGPGPVQSPFNARVVKVERLGELFAVDIAATEDVFRSAGRQGENCTARIVGLAEVNVVEGSLVASGEPIGRLDAADDYTIRCKSVRPAS